MNKQPPTISFGAGSVVAVFSGISVVVSGLAVIGWLTGIRSLTTLGWEQSVTSFNPALCTALLALAGLSTVFAKPTVVRRAAVVAITAFVAFMSFATVLEYGFSLDFGIDQMFFKEPFVPGVYIAGRMAPATALALFPLSLSVFLNNWRQGAWLSQLAAGGSGLVCSIALSAWVFDQSAFFDFLEFTRLGAGTAISLVSLTVATIAVSYRNTSGEVIWSGVAGGYMSRRMLAMSFTLPPLFAVVIYQGERLGWYSGDLSLGLLTVSIVALFVPSTLYLASSANRLSRDLEENSRQNKDMAAQLTAVIESMPVGVLVLDATSRRPIQVNRRSLEICGELMDDAVPGIFSGIRALLQENGEPYPMENLPQEIAIREGRGAVANDIVAVRPDGSRLNLKIQAQPALDKNGKAIAVVTVIEDVTKEHDAQRQKTEYISVVSHQLKSPLTSIRWIMESMLGGDYGATSNEQQDAARQALISSERMLALVKDLLSASRVESDRLDIKPRWITSPDFIDGVVKEMTPNAAERKISIKVDNRSTRRLYADPALLEQVVSNFLSNAVKYSPEESVVDVAVHDDEDRVSVEVTDRGIGIPPEQAGRIFSKFFRTDNAKRTSVEGTGLGLYVCKSIVESLGGSIGFTSDLGRGSTFRFTIPFEHEKAAAEKEAEVTKKA